jgi:hypothetical protein
VLPLRRRQAYLAKKKIFAECSRVGILLGLLGFSKPDDPPSLKLRRGMPAFRKAMARQATQQGAGRETSRFANPVLCLLPNLPKKILHCNPSVAQRSFQCVTIHFRMEGKHNSSSIRVLHLEVASLAMDFQKTEPLQCGQHLPARQQRQLHSVNSTTSRSLVEINSDGDGSKYKSMASRIFFNASSRVLPCDQQLFSAGQCATK